MKRATEKRSKTSWVPHCVEECSMSSPSYNNKEWTRESDVRNTTRTSFVQASGFTMQQTIRLIQQSTGKYWGLYLEGFLCILHYWITVQKPSLPLPRWSSTMTQPHAFSLLPFSLHGFFLIKHYGFSSKMHSTHTNNDSHSASSRTELAANQSLYFWWDWMSAGEMPCSGWPCGHISSCHNSSPAVGAYGLGQQ